MKTHSSDHVITNTTDTTAVMMTATCGTFNKWAHSLWSPLGFRLVFLYFLQSFWRVWSTVATSTATSAIYSRGRDTITHQHRCAIVVAVHFTCSFELSLQSVRIVIG